MLPAVLRICFWRRELDVPLEHIEASACGASNRKAHNDAFTEDKK